MSIFIDQCHEGSIGIETIFRKLLYTDGANYYINFLDSELSENDVQNISDCEDNRSVEQLFRLSLVEDLSGNPAISTVFISEGSQCLDSCEYIGVETLLYKCFYKDSSGNIHLGIKEECSLMLNQYPNSFAAYSLRLVNCDYSGYCVRVRESGGDTVQDIGFVNGVIDTTALLNHCGANDGFVVTWHDQSGNGLDVSQSTPLDQPKIVNAGALININGNPSIDFDGANTYLVSSSNIGITGSSNRCITEVVERDNNLGIEVHFSWGDLSASGTIVQLTSEYFLRFNAITKDYSTTGAAGNQELIYIEANGTTMDDYVLYLNGVAGTPGTVVDGNVNTVDSPLYIGCRSTDTSLVFDGRMQELVIWESCPDRTGVQNNINNFYNIY